MGRPTSNLTSAPTIEQLTDGKYTKPKFYPLNTGSAGVISGIDITGVQGFSVTPDGGNETEVFQAGGGEQSLREEENVGYSGEFTILAGDLKLILLLAGYTAGAFNATDGYGVSARAKKAPIGHLVNEVLVKRTTTVQHFQIIPAIFPDNFGFDWTVSDDAEITVPFKTEYPPIFVTSEDASNASLTPKYELFAYSAGGSYVVTKAPALIQKDGIVGYYDDKVIEVRKFTASTDKNGSIVTAFAEASGTVTPTTNITTGQFISVLYLATTTDSVP